MTVASHFHANHGCVLTERKKEEDSSSLKIFIRACIHVYIRMWSVCFLFVYKGREEERDDFIYRLEGRASSFHTKRSYWMKRRNWNFIRHD